MKAWRAGGTAFGPPRLFTTARRWSRPVGAHRPSLDQLARLEAILGAGGVRLTGVSGVESLEPWARERGIAFQLVEPSAEAEAANCGPEQTRREVELSDGAPLARRGLCRSSRRHRPAAQARRDQRPASRAATGRAAAAPHAGGAGAGDAIPRRHATRRPGPPPDRKRRGGWDVNPGAELVATGDIAVFGRLAGVAHAGAQGDEKARIYALELDATAACGIATCIAADAPARAGRAQPEAASVEGGRIVIAPLNALEHAAEGERAR